VNPRRRALCLGLGLGLLAFSALFFFKPLEDAYVLPQRLGLALAALALSAGVWDLPLPSSRVFRLGLAFFAWRLFCHLVSPDDPAGLPWLLAQIPQWILFLTAAAALQEAAVRRKAAAVLLVAGSLGAAYALLAPLGWDPFAGGSVDLGFGRRAHGSLGNPDFLGGWLAMLLPLAVASAALSTGRARRWAAGAGALLALALLLTLARGSWAAAAVGSLTAGAVLGLRPKLMVAGLWAGGLLLVAGLIVSWGAGTAGLTGRLREAADLRSDAWGSRAFMASVALDLAREHPFTGVGGGAFEMEYLRRQGERLQTETAQPFRLTADAHNDWAQAAAETGFPGLLLWGLLFALAMRAAWLRGGGDGAAVAGALAAFGVQACFHFPWDIVPTAGLALLALAAAAGFGEPAPWVGARGWPLLAALAVVLCLGMDLRAAGASALLNSGTSLQSNAAGGPLGAALLRASAALGPDDERAWSRLGAAQMQLSDPAAATGSFQRALQCLPSSAEDWTNLGLCLGLTDRLEGAAASLRQAVRLDPRSNEAWADEAKTEYLLGHKDEALSLARQGIVQAGGSAQAWFNLGGMLYNSGRLDQAAPAFEAALRLDPAYPQAAALLQACRHAR
jgi:tetratricopeptide (TPR) repeat protein